MTLTEILDELPRLDDIERQTVFHRLVAMDAGLEVDETPEMLAAVDAGVESLKTAPAISLQQARQHLGEWITR